MTFSPAPLAPTALPPFSEAYLSAWTSAWIPDALIAAATAAFAVGWARDRRPGRVGRAAAWVAAMAVLVLCFNSSIGIYSDTLFWVHMVQHLLLIMVVPPLVVWADPLTLVPAGPGGRSLADRLDDSRTWRAVTNPALTVPVYAVVVVLTHLTSFQQIAVQNPPVRLAENVIYLISGYLLFARLVQPGEPAHRLPDLVRLIVLVAAMGVDTLTGVAIMMTDRPLAPAYAASHPGWPPGALADQAAAGAVMWFAGDGVMMLLMIVVGVMWGMQHQDSGLGDWLEEIRRREILGGAEAAPADAGADVDREQAALDAYNARLAALAELDRRRTAG